MKDPKITVLMSVFNGVRYLPEAVESILCQSFADFEFLIIDDGSTEPVADIIQSFKDPRIRFRRQENMGLTRSLNRGIRPARGEYIARADADDISLTGRLEAQAKLFESNPQLDLVGSFFQTIDASGNIVAEVEAPVDPVYRLWRLQFHNVYAHGAAMFRKSALINAGLYDCRYACAQDYDLWSRISGPSNTSLVPDILYSYRVNGNGLRTSEKHYHEQIANAAEISNRSLKACNPDLDVAGCADVRAIYWNFEGNGHSMHGLRKLESTFDGFCRRFGIEGRQRNRLYQEVCDDVSRLRLCRSTRDGMTSLEI